MKIKDPYFFPCGHPRMDENIKGRGLSRPSGWCAECDRIRNRKRALDQYYLDPVAANIKAKAWRKANPEKEKQHRKKSRMKCYGLIPDAKEQMLVAQGGRCLACGTTDPRSQRGWCIDHDHKTKEVRGILCHPCNLIVGLAQEHAEHCEAVATYICMIQRPPVEIRVH